MTSGFAGLVGFTVNRNDFSFTVCATQLVQGSFGSTVSCGVRRGVNTEATIFFLGSGIVIIAHLYSVTAINRLTIFIGVRHFDNLGSSNFWVCNPARFKGGFEIC
ncbi:hypothetical protein NGUA11_04608 [Salmonella enterica]|nr:hypothetical protein NGUA11_04608 [Salmonella enterica]